MIPRPAARGASWRPMRGTSFTNRLGTAEAGFAQQTRAAGLGRAQRGPQQGVG